MAAIYASMGVDEKYIPNFVTQHVLESELQSFIDYGLLNKDEYISALLGGLSGKTLTDMKRYIENAGLIFSPQTIRARQYQMQIYQEGVQKNRDQTLLSTFLSDIIKEATIDNEMEYNAR